MAEGLPQHKELCKRVGHSIRKIEKHRSRLARVALHVWYIELVVGLPCLSLGPPEFYVPFPECAPLAMGSTPL